MFRVVDDELRKRVLDDALEGKRGAGEVATEHGVSIWAVRTWLEQHYAEHPEDPRRHLIQRESEKYQRASEPPPAPVADAPPEAEPPGPDAPDDGDDNQAREDMGQKKRDRPTPTVGYASKGRHPKREEAMALLAAGELSQAAIARKLGVSEGTVSFWAKAAKVEPIRKAQLDKARAAVIADLKAGYSGGSLVARHKKIAGKTAIYRWVKEYREEQEDKAEKRKAGMAHAREAKLEKLKDPEYRELNRQRHWKNRAKAEPAPNGQIALPIGESTRLSRPEPEPRSERIESQIAAQMVRREPPSTVAVVRYQAEFPPDSQSQMLTDTLREAIDERNTLRGMVTLLQREQDSLKKQLDLYRRTFGEINQR